MEMDDLRRRLGAILAAEEQQPPDWAAVDRLTDELLQQLVGEPNTECPEIVNHYLDDADIRSKDDAYGGRQREQISRFVGTGEYKDSTPIPFWTCAIALALAVGVIGWILW
jgi:hypothetical protein